MIKQATSEVEENKVTESIQSIATSPKTKYYEFYINDKKANKGYGFDNNSVKTTKYNIFTFLPKSLLFILYRPELIYYLILIILENISIISPVIPVSTMVPYLLVLIIKLIREGVEDYFRYRYDKDVNTQKTIVYRKGEWKTVNSGDLYVGEIVLVKKEETFPADLMLIDSDKDEGVAFIETSTLDGECSLKKKFPPKLMSENINSEGKYKNKFKSYIGKIKCDEPNTEIFKFNGVVEFHYEEETQIHVFAVDNSQMLLKGAKLKTNEWACGIVVYTGQNTKLIKNLSKPKIKNSKVFNKMTNFVLLVFLIQAVLCSISAGLNYYNYTTYVQVTNYMYKSSNPKLSSFLVYFSYLIIFKFMVPITLYVTFEVVRVCQAYFLWVNTELYSFTRKKFTKVNTISVIEELGDINFVFTDKTGTLTVNKLDMRYCIIGTKCYEHLDKELDSKKAHEGIIKLEDNYLKEFLKKEQQPEYPKWPEVKVLCESNEKIEMTIEKESDLIIEFWKALALAHECVAVDKQDCRDYVGLSPDDIVLVKAAAKQGIILEKLDKASSRKLKILDEDHEFEVLNVFEFNSDRKKLSIIVREKGQIKLFIKGADSEIKKLISPNSNLDFNDEAEHYVDFFSQSGLRTLYVGMKLIDEDEYKNWLLIWEKANKDLTNKEAEIKKAQMLMEKDIFLLGATVVEDELQDQVAETIKDLRQAGIKVWMLTGDKMTTAYNIGLSCGMIHKYNQIFFSNGEKGDEFSTLKKEYDMFIDSNKHLRKLPGYSIVIDSIILSTVFASESLTRQFIEVSNKAESVICCRVSPLQKSSVVRLMRKYHSETISLAIGDGGNDVSMILEANIGVGVYGEEGLRAVNSADFAIGEFKILRNLLLVYGRICNKNMNTMILAFFYKSYVFCLIHFYFGFYNLFSAQTIYDDWLLTFYNILFTFYPIVFKCFSDWDLKPSDGRMILDLAPELYKENREYPIMNAKTYFYELARGMIHSAINFFFIAYGVTSNTAVDSEGYLSDLWYLATCAYTFMFICSINRVSYTSRNINIWYPFSVVFLSIIPVSMCMIGINLTLSSKSHAVMAVTWGSARFYLNMILICSTCLLYDWSEECFFSLFGNKLANRLLLIVKQHGKINKFESLPEDVMRSLRYYKGQETVTSLNRKDKVIDVVNTENIFIKT